MHVGHFWPGFFIISSLLFIIDVHIDTAHEIIHLLEVLIVVSGSGTRRRSKQLQLVDAVTVDLQGNMWVLFTKTAQMSLLATSLLFTGADGTTKATTRLKRSDRGRAAELVGIILLEVDPIRPCQVLAAHVPLLLNHLSHRSDLVYVNRQVLLFFSHDSCDRYLLDTLAILLLHHARLLVI